MLLDPHVKEEQKHDGKHRSPHPPGDAGPLTHNYHLVVGVFQRHLPLFERVGDVVVKLDQLVDLSAHAQPQVLEHVDLFPHHVHLLVIAGFEQSQVQLVVFGQLLGSGLVGAQSPQGSLGRCPGSKELGPHVSLVGSARSRVPGQHHRVVG